MAPDALRWSVAILLLRRVLGGPIAHPLNARVFPFLRWVRLTHLVLPYTNPFGVPRHGSNGDLATGLVSGQRGPPRPRPADPCGVPRKSLPCDAWKGTSCSNSVLRGNAL